MTEIVGACLSQFHDDENSFELLLGYADGREFGHLVSRAAAQRIAAEFANEFPTAALSAEQTQPVAVKALEWSEPVGYQQLKDGKWVECSHFVAFGWSDRLDKDCRPIYAHAPLSREGEDTAEVLRSALQRICELTPARANAKDARDLYHTVKAIADAALAATRSGSATEAKGCAE